MALKFTPKVKRIEFAEDNFIEVRGLGLADVSQLVDVHAQTAVEIFNKFTGRDSEAFTVDDMATVAQQLLIKFPGVVAHTIALAADEPNQIDVISKLPVGAQVEALETIGQLTFEMQGGLGNFVETVTRLARGANGLAKMVPSLPNSPNGSTDSTGK